jgi:hypothetical protein
MSFTRNIYFKNIRRTLPTGIKPGPREQPYKRFAHRYTHGKAWATLDQQIQIIQNFLRWQGGFPTRRSIGGQGQAFRINIERCYKQYYLLYPIIDPKLSILSHYQYYHLYPIIDPSLLHYCVCDPSLLHYW